MTERARILVVAGLIIRGDRVLLTQRTATQPMPHKWEFPGGKVEPGEAPTAALARELREELGVRAIVGRVWDVVFHAYADFDVVMIVYGCRIAEGEPTPIEVAALAWVAPAELCRCDILAADHPLVARLETEGLPAN